MLFSCKITHSIINYLDRRGEERETLFEKFDWPSEFLRDPACWLEADKMEMLLSMIDAQYGGRADLDDGVRDALITSVGHQCKDLRAWGVLDSVLRMVQTPKDLFAQPERLLSYFVSPAPPLGEIRRGPHSVAFVLPVSELQYPFVTEYLRAALEALPTYINKPMASVTWRESRVEISWSENQTSLFSEAQSTELSLHPELVRNILANLETSQKELEEMKARLLAKDQEIDALRNKLIRSDGPAQPSVMPVPAAPSSAGGAVWSEEASVRFEQPVSLILSEIYRLGDYLARGHQLITLLVGQGLKTPQVQEAMRRVDWSHVVVEGPQTVKRVVHGLQSVQEALRTSDTPSVFVETSRPKALPSDERAPLLAALLHPADRL